MAKKPNSQFETAKQIIEFILLLLRLAGAIITLTSGGN